MYIVTWYKLEYKQHIAHSTVDIENTWFSYGSQ